jgi:hypothetical protein
MRRQGNGHTQHAERKKRRVVNQQSIAVEEELRERNPRWAHRMVRKIKEGYKLRTFQCKDTKGNIIDDKGRWKEHFEETLNENKTAIIDIQQNQMHTEWGSENTGTDRA